MTKIVVRDNPKINPPPSYPSRLSRLHRPTWIEINLHSLRNNYKQLRSFLKPNIKILAVIKANAYGHGAAEVAQNLAREPNPPAMFGATSVEEGIHLRKKGISSPLLILGSLYPFDSYEACLEYQLTPTIASLEAAKALVRTAEKYGKKIAVHVKIETGMGRIGVSPQNSIAVFTELNTPWTYVEGAYTHFARANDHSPFTQKQLHQFQELLLKLESLRLRPPMAHAAKTATILKNPETHLDMVRPGLALYGLWPDPLGFQPILSFKSTIVFLKMVPAGYNISYGGTYKTKRPSRIATLPVGYADGLFRELSNKGEVLVRGKRCPIVGAITMDMLMVDVSRVPEAKVGDEVVLIGHQGNEEIKAPSLAKKIGTIPYEITCRLAHRVPRIYFHAARTER